MDGRQHSAAPVLETQRLRLRPWLPADAALHRQLWQERDPRVPARRRISADGHPTVAELEAWSRDHDRMPEPGLLVVERKDSGEAIGYCGLVASSVGVPDEPELAFELAQASWNQGFATEAAAAVLDHARALGYRRLSATVREWNLASLRVLAKLGFAATGEVERDTVHGDSLLLLKEL